MEDNYNIEVSSGSDLWAVAYIYELTIILQ